MSDDKTADDLELLARLRRQLPEVELEVQRCEAILQSAQSNVEYVRDGINEVLARVCSALMPSNIAVAGPAAAPQPEGAINRIKREPPQTWEDVKREVAEFVNPPRQYEWDDPPPSDSTPQADEIPEGFTKWEGGHPATAGIEYDTTVELIQRDGKREITLAGGVLRWWHERGMPESDIIAYRVISDQVRPTDPEPSPAADRIEPTPYGKEHEQVD